MTIFSVDPTTFAAALAGAVSGDELDLVPGNYGHVTITGRVNTSAITIKAAAGAVPVFYGLTITGSAYWTFQGIKTLADPAGPPPVNELSYLISIDKTSSHITYKFGKVATQDDVSSWTDADWASKNWSGINAAGASSFIQNTELYNVRNALSVSGDNSNITLNRIHDYGNDGIEFNGNGITIHTNTMTLGHHTPSENLHADGIQGYPKPDGTPSANCVIDGNLIVKGPLADYTQGISIFDGKWSNLTVQNNVVINNVWNAIALYGIQGGKVVNNSVSSLDPAKVSWLQITAAKDGTPSANIVISNNITADLKYAGTNVTADHNLATNSIADATSYHGSDGWTDANGNLVYKHPTTVFVDPTADLHLLAGSPAIGMANTATAPHQDIENRTRVAPMDVGAYL